VEDQHHRPPPADRTEVGRFQLQPAEDPLTCSVIFPLRSISFDFSASSVTLSIMRIALALFRIDARTEFQDMPVT
jgi:hypothetical protein